MGDDGGGGGGGGPDTRTDWMRARVLSALRCKEEKFDKLLTGEEASTIHSFLDSDLTRIIIFDNGKGDLTAVSKLGTVAQLTLNLDARLHRNCMHVTSLFDVALHFEAWSNH